MIKNKKFYYLTVLGLLFMTAFIYLITPKITSALYGLNIPSKAKSIGEENGGYQWQNITVVKMNTSDKLTNTIWISKISPNCVDTLKFLTNGNILSYSCEIQFCAKGIYTLNNGLIIAYVNEDAHGSASYWKYTYIQKNDALIPIRSEEYYGGTWHLVKSNFDKTYLFEKIH